MFVRWWRRSASASRQRDQRERERGDPLSAWIQVRANVCVCVSLCPCVSVYLCPCERVQLRIGTGRQQQTRWARRCKDGAAMPANGNCSCTGFTIMSLTYMSTVY